MYMIGVYSVMFFYEKLSKCFIWNITRQVHTPNVKVVCSALTWGYEYQLPFARDAFDQ